MGIQRLLVLLRVVDVVQHVRRLVPAFEVTLDSTPDPRVVDASAPLLSPYKISLRHEEQPRRPAGRVMEHVRSFHVMFRRYVMKHFHVGFDISPKEFLQEFVPREHGAGEADRYLVDVCAGVKHLTRHAV